MSHTGDSEAAQFGAQFSDLFSTAYSPDVRWSPNTAPSRSRTQSETVRPSSSPKPLPRTKVRQGPNKGPSKGPNKGHVRFHSTIPKNSSSPSDQHKRNFSSATSGPRAPLSHSSNNFVRASSFHSKFSSPDSSSSASHPAKITSRSKSFHAGFKPNPATSRSRTVSEADKPQPAPGPPKVPLPRSRTNYGDAASKIVYPTKSVPPKFPKKPKDNKESMPDNVRYPVLVTDSNVISDMRKRLQKRPDATENPPAASGQQGDGQGVGRSAASTTTSPPPSNPFQKPTIQKPKQRTLPRRLPAPKVITPGERPRPILTRPQTVPPDFSPDLQKPANPNSPRSATLEIVSDDPELETEPEPEPKPEPEPLKPEPKPEPVEHEPKPDGEYHEEEIEGRPRSKSKGKFWKRKEKKSKKDRKGKKDKKGSSRSSSKSSSKREKSKKSKKDKKKHKRHTDDELSLSKRSSISSTSSVSSVSRVSAMSTDSVPSLDLQHERTGSLPTLEPVDDDLYDGPTKIGSVPKRSRSKKRGGLPVPPGGSRSGRNERRESNSRSVSFSRSVSSREGVDLNEAKTDSSVTTTKETPEKTEKESDDPPPQKSILSPLTPTSKSSNKPNIDFSSPVQPRTRASTLGRGLPPPSSPTKGLPRPATLGRLPPPSSPPRGGLPAPGRGPPPSSPPRYGFRAPSSPPKRGLPAPSSPQTGPPRPSLPRPQTMPFMRLPPNASDTQPEERDETSESEESEPEDAPTVNNVLTPPAEPAKITEATEKEELETPSTEKPIGEPTPLLTPPPFVPPTPSDEGVTDNLTTKDAEKPAMEESQIEGETTEPEVDEPDADESGTDEPDVDTPTADTDDEFLASGEDTDEELPEGWSKYYTEDGDAYYYHTNTHECLWTLPTAEGVNDGIEDEQPEQSDVAEALEKKLIRRQPRNSLFARNILVPPSFKVKEKRISVAFALSAHLQNRPDIQHLIDSSILEEAYIDPALLGLVEIRDDTDEDSESDYDDINIEQDNKEDALSKVKHDGEDHKLSDFANSLEFEEAMKVGDLEKVTRLLVEENTHRIDFTSQDVCNIVTKAVTKARIDIVLQMLGSASKQNTQITAENVELKAQLETLQNQQDEREQELLEEIGAEIQDLKDQYHEREQTLTTEVQDLQERERDLLREVGHLKRNLKNIQFKIGDLINLEIDDVDEGDGED